MNLSSEDHQKITEWAKDHPDIKCIYLYGSRARGDNRPDSDIDLAVEMKPNDEESIYTTWIYWHRDYLQAPDLHLTHEVQLEWYEKNAGLEKVGPGVEKDGLLIYPESVQQ